MAARLRCARGSPGQLASNQPHVRRTQHNNDRFPSASGNNCPITRTTARRANSSTPAPPIADVLDKQIGVGADFPLHDKRRFGDRIALLTREQELCKHATEAPTASDLPRPRELWI
jgi:hypothetical protein